MDAQIEYLKNIPVQKLKNIFGDVVEYDQRFKKFPVAERYESIKREFTEFIRLNLLNQGHKDPLKADEFREYLKLQKDEYTFLLYARLNVTLHLIAEVELYFGKQFIPTEKY